MLPHDALSGPVAVVTGSSRGLGGMARELGLHGAAVVLGARSDDAVAAAVERLRAEGIAASGRRCDTGDLADVEALRDEAISRGRLDIWINNAGTSGVYGPTASTPVDDFTRVVRTNILGTFHGARVALQVVVALWGQSAGQAARPIVDLVTSDAAAFRFLTKRRLVTHGLRNILGGRLRRTNRMPLQVTVVHPDPQP